MANPLIFLNPASRWPGIGLRPRRLASCTESIYDQIMEHVFGRGGDMASREAVALSCRDRSGRAGDLCAFARMRFGLPAPPVPHPF